MARTRRFWLGLACLCAAVAAPAGDWPQLGGPHRDGAVPEAELPAEGIRLETLWQRPLGSGYSGIALAAGLAVTMYGDGENDRLAALDAATGATRWTAVLGETYRGHDGSEDGPLSTPLIHEGRVFAVTPRGDLVAVTLEDGRELWRKSLPASYRAVAPEYGFTTSPLAAGDRIVVQVGGGEGHGLCAFDAATGELRWKLGDEAAEYRSPTPVRVGGKTMIVVVANRAIRGVDPETGTALWEQTFAEDRFDGVANLTALPGGRFVVTGWELSRLYAVVPTDEGFTIEQRWETTELKQSYNSPVQHDGLIYGYSAAYLVAVDAETGARVWKSRPPGKGAPIVVGNRLAVWALGGKLFLAPAGRSGFAPEATADVLETAGLTAPAFAEGAFYVRNLDAIAAVAVREGAAGARLSASEIPEPTSTTAFGRFLREIEVLPRAAEKAAAIDAWLAEHPALPLVEGERTVHFVYRGAGADVGVDGVAGDSQSLRRVAGTDLFYRSYELDPGSRIEYAFVVDFGEPQPDPRNPLRAHSAKSDRSELRMPGWKVPDWLPEPGRGKRGKLESFPLTSAALGDSRTVFVYLPPGYADSSKTYPLLVVTDIYGTRLDGRLPEIVDRMEESGRPVPVVAFVPFGEGFAFWPEGYADRRDAMVAFVADEMVPQVEARFRIRNTRADRAVAGFGWGAFPALYAAVMRGDVFGNVATISMLTYAPLNDELAALLAAQQTREPLEVYAGWGAYDTNDEFQEHISLPEMNRQAAAILANAGHHVTTREISAGPGWGSWWAHLGPLMDRWLAPPRP